MCSAMCAMPGAAVEARAGTDRDGDRGERTGRGLVEHGELAVRQAPGLSQHAGHRHAVAFAAAPARSRTRALSPAVEHRHRPLEEPRPLRRVGEPRGLGLAPPSLDQDRLPDAELTQALRPTVPGADAALLHPAERQAWHARRDRHSLTQALPLSSRCASAMPRSRRASTRWRRGRTAVSLASAQGLLLVAAPGRWGARDRTSPRA